jgi:hypothetical protein
MEVPLILKKQFLVLMNHIHGLLVALADGEQTVEELEESRAARGGGTELIRGGVVLLLGGEEECAPHP